MNIVDRVRLCVKILESVKFSSLTPIPLTAISEDAAKCVQRSVLFQSLPKEIIPEEMFPCSLNFAVENSDYSIEGIHSKLDGFYITRGINSNTVFVLHDVFDNKGVLESGNLINEPKINPDAANEIYEGVAAIQPTSTQLYSVSDDVNDVKVDQNVYVSGLFELHKFVDYKTAKMSELTGTQKYSASRLYNRLS